MHHFCRRALLVFAALSLVSAFYSATANATEHEEVTSRSFALPDDGRFRLTNLAGEIVLELATGDQWRRPQSSYVTTAVIASASGGRFR
ncbi:hypothetical protein BH24PSE2_BH24PSE2_04770 [soil metagenome]